MTPIKKKLFLKQFCCVLVYWLVLLGCVFGYAYYLECQKVVNNIKDKEKVNVTLGRYALKDQFLERVSDLLMLSKVLSLQEHNIINNDVNHIVNELKLVSEEKRCYDQIRLINSTGYEVIRVNLEEGKATSVPIDQLQNKKHRYYFKESNHLFEKEIYISPLDLNIEYGAIEEPIKPMIRMAITVYNQEKQKIGVLILNYLAQKLLDRLSYSIPEQSQRVSLLNADGYWLMSNDSKKNWGFMFDNDERFQKYYPQAWEKIRQEDSGQFETVEGVFTFASIYPVTESLREHQHIKHITSEDGSLVRGYVWKLVSFVQKSEIEKVQEEIREKFYYVTLLLLVILMIINWRLAIYRTKHRLAEIALQRSHQRLEQKVRERTRELQLEVEIRKKAEESMRHMASYDGLTDIPNRALLIENLESVMAMNKRYKTRSALLFIDLDGFKRVNDDFGHEVGDHLLQQVSRRLSKTVRKSDMVGRYGGDEFVVLLTKINVTDDAIRVAEEVVEVVSQSYEVDGLNIQISCSIGIALYKDSYLNPQQYINVADSAMYQIKKTGKNHYKLADD